MSQTSEAYDPNWATKATDPTVDGVAARLTVIGENVGDDELRHIAEKKLWEDVLVAIAEGKLTGEDARQVTELALATREFDFSRWYA